MGVKYGRKRPRRREESVSVRDGREMGRRRMGEARAMKGENGGEKGKQETERAR
jgi:hypothetical protein